MVSISMGDTDGESIFVSLERFRRQTRPQADVTEAIQVALNNSNNKSCRPAGVIEAPNSTRGAREKKGLTRSFAFSCEAESGPRERRRARQ